MLLHYVFEYPFKITYMLFSSCENLNLCIKLIEHSKTAKPSLNFGQVDLNKIKHLTFSKVLSRN